MKSRHASRRPSSLKQKRRSFFSWLMPTLKEEQKGSRRLRFEALEDRRVLAANLMLAGTQTIIAGANINASNEATVQAEMQTTVNPANPLNVVAFSHRGNAFQSLGLYYSTDGGVNWSTTTVGAANDGFGAGDFRFDPACEFDAAGNLYVAYGIRSGTTRRVVVARSQDGGATINQTTLIDTQADIGTLPGVDRWNLGTGPDGLGGNAIYIAYTQNVAEPGTDQRIVVAGSNNAGTTFSAPLTINDDSIAGTNSGNLTADPSVGPNGELYVSWFDISTRILFDRDLNGLFVGGANFGADITVVSDGDALPVGTADLEFSLSVPAQAARGVSAEPELDVDRSPNGATNGNLYIAFMNQFGGNDTDIMLARSTNQGATWTFTSVEASTRTEFLPWVDVDQTSGAVGVAHYQSTPDNASAPVNVQMAISIDGGLSFPGSQKSILTTATSTAPGGNDFLEYIGLGLHGGTAHALWSDTTTGNQESFVSTSPLINAANQLVITGGAGVDNVILRRSAVNSNFVEVVENGVVTFAGLASVLGSIAVNTLGGSDTLTVDFANGNPVPASGLSYDGGTEAGTDLLVLRNGAFSNETSSATGGGSGTIAFSGGALGTANITYTALEPVDDTVAVVNYTFNATAAGEIINITDGPVTNGFLATQINSGSGTFELQNIANKTNVTVNGVAGSDTFNVTYTTANVAAGLATLRANSGAVGAVGSTFNVQSTPAGVTTTLNGTGAPSADTFNVSSNAPANTGNLDAIDGVLALGPGFASDGDTLTISESGSAAADTVTVNLLFGSDTISGTAGGGWTVRVGSVGTISGYVDSGITLNLGSGNDVVNVLSLEPFSGGDIEALTVNGNGGDDTFNVTGGGLGASSVLNLNGNAGDDIFNINAPITASATVNVDGGPHVLGDALNINAGGADVVQNGNAQFVVGGPINYVNIETVLLTNLNSLTVNGDGGNNQHVLTRTAANRFRSLLDGGPPVFFDRPLSAGTQFTFNGLGGDDTETIDNGAAGGVVNLRAAFNGGTNSPVGSEVSGPPGDTLIITGNPGAVVARETYLVGATQDAGVWVLDPDGSKGAGASLASNGDELIETFTGLEPVDTDTPAAVFDVILPGGAGTNDDLTIDNVGSPLNGFAAVRVLDNAGTFETFRFARKDTTRIMANLNNGGGIDTFRLNYSTAPATASGGAFTLETYGHIAPGVLGQPADDNGTDHWALIGTAATTTNNLLGQGGSDRFNNYGGVIPFGTNTLDGLAGTLNITGGETGGDDDEIGITDGASTAVVGDLATLTNVSLTGAAPASINYSEIEDFEYEATSLADTINILSTAAGTNYVVSGSGDADTITIGNQTADFVANVFDGSLDTILGILTIVPEGLFGSSAADTLNIDDSGTAALAGVASITNVGSQTPMTYDGFPQTGALTSLVNFASANINYFHGDGTSGVIPFGNRLEFLNVRTSTGNDVVNVNDTTAVTQTILDTRQGNDLVTITGDNLSGANLFRGLGTPSVADGNDDFILNIAVHIGNNGFAPTTSLQIEGNANTAVNSANRDRVTINDNNAGFVRDLTYDYLDTQGDLDILANSAGNGLFGGEGAGLIPVNIRTMETLRFNAAGAPNDLITVSGTSADDVITVAQTPTVAGISAQSSAFVFLNGNPYITSPGAIVPPDSLAGNFPGVAGGGTGVDMLINGIAPASGQFGPTGGLTLDGSGTSAIGNRAIVQALSENNLLDPVSAGAAVDVFNLGLGAGVLVPGTGVNAAFDLVSMNGAFAFDNDVNPFGIASSPNQVLVQNIASGLLVPVTVLPASFVNGAAPSSRAGLIANGGDEAAARGAGFANPGVADNFFATPHPLFTLGVNGNLPVFGPLGTDGFPAGDQLNLNSPTSFSIWSDKQTPPNVTIMAGNGPFGVIDSSIERTRLFPGNGVVNLIGDQNNPAVDQTDNFVVRGIDIDPGSSSDGGVQEMAVVVNGSAPILIEGVNRLNTYGYDLVGQDLNSPFPNAPDAPATGATADDIDTLEITPFADNAGPNFFGVGNNSPRGWGVGVVFNEGSPAQQDGNQQDLLIVHTSIGVNNGLNAFGGGIASEDIVVQPSGPDNGEVRVTNAVDGSVIMVVSYINNTDLIIVDDDGSVSDTDSLTLRGTDPNTVQTSGNETFAVDFDAAGAVATPMVSVTDTASGNILYRLRSFTDPSPGGVNAPFAAVTFDMLAGNDTLNFRTPIGPNFASGVDRVNVLGGQGDDAVLVNMAARDIMHEGGVGRRLFVDGGSGADSLTFSGTPTIPMISVTYNAGPIAGNGQVLHNDGGVSNQIVDFVNLEPVVDLVPAATLIVNANNAANAINFASTPGDATRGRVSIDDQEYIDFSGKVTLTINALAGADAINLTIPAAPPTALTGINVDGGDPSNGDTVNIITTSAANTVTFTPTSAEGMNVIGLPGLATNVVITNTAAVTYDGNTPAAGVPNDILTISGTAGDDTTNVNPTGIGTATFQSGLSPLLTLRGFTALTANAGTGGFDDLIVTGTNGVDTLTSAANVLTMVGTVTIGANIDRLQVNVLDGDDSVTLTGVTIPATTTTSGGDGNDTLIGSPNADLILGGRGNDIIVGGAGVDNEYGEDGNDIFGNATLTPNAVADDAGADFAFGGPGFDNFVWEPGDGADINNGGEDAADVFRFFGSAVAQTFTLQSGGTPTHFNALIGALVIDNHGIEDVIVDGQGGADTFLVNDLYATEVVSINLNLGAADAGAIDPVTVNGREVADNVVMTTPAAGSVSIQGLRYNVNLTNAELTDTLTVNGNSGDDSIKAEVGVEGVIAITLNGNSGDDFLSADAIINGGTGDDFLEGGAGADTINGNDGNDTIRGGTGIDVMSGDAGDDTFLLDYDGSVDNYFGGDGYDTLVVSGTPGNDVITANQLDATIQLQVTLNGFVETNFLQTAGGVRTLERVRIEAGTGDDTVALTAADVLGTDALVNSVLFDVDGGPANTRDRLSVQDNGTGDLVLYRQGTTSDSGSISVGPGNAEALETVFTGFERVDPIAAAGGAIRFFKLDTLEWNDEIANASHLGADETINVDPNIDPGLVSIPGFANLPADNDFFRIVAEKTGTLDIQVYFTQLATVPSGRPGLPNAGNLDLELYDADGTLIVNGLGGPAPNPSFGLNDATDNERIRIPAVAGQTYYLRVFPNGTAINTYSITTINAAAPVPFDIELLDTPLNTVTNATTGAPGATAVGLSSDTGRSRFDDITYDNDPTILIRVPNVVIVAGSAFLDDVPANGAAPGSPFDEQILIPFRPADLALNAGGPGFRVAVFVTEIGTDNTAPRLAGYAQLETTPRPGVFTFTFANDYLVPDGSYYISASVEMIDPSLAEQNQGFGELADSLEAVIDTTLPPASFGSPSVANDGLILSDECPTPLINLTNVARPTFWGRAEADTVINLYLDSNANGAFEPATDVFLGQTVATPFDGGDQYPNGYWEIESRLSLNDPSLVPPLPFDGPRTLFITAEDVAGNITGSPTAVVATTLQIVLDTQGPQVTDVDINNAGNPYDLFDPKPSTDGPTPLVNSLVISLRDLPPRVAGSLYTALDAGQAATPGLYHLVGDYNGIIPISQIIVINNAPVAGQIATATIELVFANPLPDDRYTLTLDDNITDPLCNKLNGESNASEPQENPSFPSGDEHAGGDFVARFTVDTRPEVGTWGAGAAWIDTNGNTTFDQNNADYTNRDITYYMGYTSDNLFAGNFVKASGGTADGFDKLAAYGKVGASWRWLVDVNNDGAITPGVDIAVVDPAGINGVPVAGNFDGNLANGDEVGVFTGTTWYFDTNHDFKIDLGSALAWSVNGYPVVGNYDGVGGDDLATYKDNVFSIDFGRNGTIDETFRFGFPTPNNRPVSADMDQDGIDDLGLFVPNRAGVSPHEDAEWYILVSDGRPFVKPGDFPAVPNQANGRIHADPIDGVKVIDYTPVPFGKDIYIQYGDEFGLPILGNFDPPVTPSSGTTPPIFPFTNPRDSLDVNNDGSITPIDALLVINEINTNGSHALDTSGFHAAPFIDTDKDNVVSPHDVLLVINKLNAPPAGSSGAEGEADAPASAHDAVFSQLGGTIAPAATSGDVGIISLLADDQVRIKRNRQAE